MNINFNKTNTEHVTYSYTENGHIHFACKTCDYYQKINLETRKVTLVSRGKIGAMHITSHAPVETNINPSQN